MQQMTPMTSITQGGIYSPRQTRAAVNQSVADSYASNNAYEARKRFNNPGMSVGLSATRNMLPMMVNGRLGAAQAQVDIPFADTQANVNHQFGAQSARENEAMGWGQIGHQQQANAASNYNRRADMGWSLFNQLMGW